MGGAGPPNKIIGGAVPPCPPTSAAYVTIPSPDP